MKKLGLLLLLLSFLSGCAEFLYQPERTRQWPDLGLRIAVVVVPDVGDAAIVQRQFVIRTVRPGTPAERADVRPGDVLLALDNKTITTVSDALEIMRNKSKFDTVLITVRRQEEILKLKASLTRAKSRSTI